MKTILFGAIMMMAVLNSIQVEASMPTNAAVSASEYNIRDFGAKGDGISDDSRAIQSAIDKAFISGGGIVLVPGSNSGWLLKKPLLIRPNVTLKGIHVGPSDSHLLSANDAGKMAESINTSPSIPGSLMVEHSKYPAITFSHDSGIQGITFVYPNQAPYKNIPIKIYPPTLQIKGFDINAKAPGINRSSKIKSDGPISGRSVTIRDVGAINSYHILDISGENPPVKYQAAQITIDGLWGYPLSVGVNIQNSLDTVMLHNIQFRPTFFGKFCAEISKTSIGFSIGKSDGCVISDILVFGLGVGILHKVIEGGYPAFSVRVSNANIEAMLPVWMDSKAVDDQVQYTNSFFFNVPFGFTPADNDVYTRKGHVLFPDLTYSMKDLSVVRLENRCEKETFQSYARFTGCGFHAYGKGPICLVGGNRLIRATLASSHMVYFKDAVLKTMPEAKVLGIVTGNDIMLYGTNLSDTAPDSKDLHLVDIGESGSGSGVIFSDNMLHGAKQSLVDELKASPKITAEGNHIPK